MAKARSLAQDALNLPNTLTFGRIVMIPLCLWFLAQDTPKSGFWAGIVFTLAALTDVLDGYLARKRGQVTVLGQFLDPLADKLFVLGTLVYLVARGRVPEWLVVLLMSRELAITGLRAVASSYGLVIAAGAGGKAKTALQTVGIVFLLIHFRYRLLIFEVHIDFHEVGTYLLYASLVMSLWSAGEYIRIFVRAAEAQARRSHDGGDDPSGT